MMTIKKPNRMEYRCPKCANTTAFIKKDKETKDVVVECRYCKHAAPLGDNFAIPIG